MAAKKPTKKKQPLKKAKKTTGRKTPAKTAKTAGRKKTPPGKKPARKATRGHAKGKKAAARKAQPREKTQSTRAFFQERERARPGRQSGDLQGLSRAEGSDSESVDELLEEGNTFEADVVLGVEDVRDEEEVPTHEVPEDDVPGEYLDKE